MDKYKNLAPVQIYCMLFLFRISSLISLTHETGYGKDIRYSLIAPFVYFLISFLIVYPAYKLDFDITKSRLLCGLYSIVFLLYASKASSIFTLFFSQSEERANNIWSVLLLFCTVAVFAACSGLHGISRSSLFLIPFTVGFIVFLMFGMVGSVESTNFVPLLSDISQPAQMVVASIADSAPLLALPALMPFFRKKSIRHFALWNLAFYVVYTLFIYFTSGILGELARHDSFPIYSASAVAELGVLKRLDAVITAVFVSCRFLLVSTMLFLFGYLGSFAFGIKSRRKLSAVGGVAVYLWAFFTSQSDSLMNVTVNFIAWFVIVLLFSVIIPTVSAIGTKKAVKATALILCTALIIPLCSCSPINELDKRLIIKGLAVDRDNKGYTVTVSALSTENAEQADTTENIKCTGKTLTEAISKSSLETGKLPYMGQNIAVIISDTLDGDDIKDCFECLYNEYEGRSSVYVFCREGKAGELLEGDSAIKPEQLYLMAQACEGAGGFTVTVADVYRASLYSSCQVVVPCLASTDDGDTAVNGAAVFNSSGVCGYLSEHGVIGTAILTNGIKDAEISLNGKLTVIKDCFAGFGFSYDDGLKAEIEIKSKDKLENEQGEYFKMCCEEALSVSAYCKSDFLRLNKQLERQGEIDNLPDSGVFVPNAEFTVMY